jgi:pullulanase
MADREQTLTVPETRGAAYRLHPVHQEASAADRDAARSRFDAAKGQFVVPARTAVVFVIP